MLALFFLGGLTGGFTHCLVMCGPVVACQAACSSQRCGNRFANASQWRYHLGRATTYGALGFLAAFLSQQIANSPYWPWLSAGMLSIAGIMFILSSLPACKHGWQGISGKTTYWRGLLLGFMPCGLIYAALMVAATLANPLHGMVAMWLFVAGTLPALMIASVGAELVTQKWQQVMTKVGRAAMAFNGLALLVMAVNIVR